jgi:hypothetical protein
MIPRQSTTVTILAAIIFASTELQSGQEVKLVLTQWDGNDQLKQTNTIGTITNADNTSSWTWQTKLMAANVAIHGSADHFRVDLRFKGNGISGSDIAIDFVGIGFVPRSGQDFDELYDPPTASEYRMSWEKSLGFLRGPGSRVDSWFARGAGMNRAIIRWRFDLASKNTRDQLAFYWSVARGTPTGEYETGGLSSFLNQLGGFAWPLLVVPGYDEVKAAFYGLPVDEEFSLFPDGRLRHLHEPGYYSGEFNIEEVFV